MSVALPASPLALSLVFSWCAESMVLSMVLAKAAMKMLLYARISC